MSSDECVSLPRSNDGTSENVANVSAKYTLIDVSTIVLADYSSSRLNPSAVNKLVDSNLFCNIQIGNILALFIKRIDHVGIVDQIDY